MIFLARASNDQAIEEVDVALADQSDRLVRKQLEIVRFISNHFYSVGKPMMKGISIRTREMVVYPIKKMRKIYSVWVYLDN